MHDFSRWLRVRAANEFKTAKQLELYRGPDAFKSLMIRYLTVYRPKTTSVKKRGGKTCCFEQTDLFRRNYKRVQMALPFLYRAYTTSNEQGGHVPRKDALYCEDSLRHRQV